MSNSQSSKEYLISVGSLWVALISLIITAFMSYRSLTLQQQAISDQAKQFEKNFQAQSAQFNKNLQEQSKQSNNDRSKFYESLKHVEEERARQWLYDAQVDLSRKYVSTRNKYSRFAYLINTSLAEYEKLGADNVGYLSGLRSSISCDWTSIIIQSRQGIPSTLEGIYKRSNMIDQVEERALAATPWLEAFMEIEAKDERVKIIEMLIESQMLEMYVDSTC